MLRSLSCDRLDVTFSPITGGPTVLQSDAFCLFSLFSSSRVQKNDFHRNLTASLSKDVRKNINHTSRGVFFSVDSWTSVSIFCVRGVGGQGHASPRISSYRLTGSSHSLRVACACVRPQTSLAAKSVFFRDVLRCGSGPLRPWAGLVEPEVPLGHPGQSCFVLRPAVSAAW